MNSNFNLVIVSLKNLRGQLEDLQKSLEQNPNVSRQDWEDFCRLSDEANREIHQIRRTRVDSQNGKGEKRREIFKTESQALPKRQTLVMVIQKAATGQKQKITDLEKAKALCVEAVVARKLGKKVTGDALMVQVRRLLEPYADGAQYVRAMLAVHRVDRRITQETMAVFAI